MGAYGIIPALAGNTADALKVRDLRKDHPRACGEHFNKLPDSIKGAGSSPRLRGTHRPGDIVGEIKGIIPALAGNTLSLSCFVLIAWDHPRACGEH